MKLDRLLAITTLLLNKSRVSAKELAEHFEVTVRTIYRDIEAINLAGIPIVSHQGTNGGFSIMENFKIDRQVLTADDIMSIITALNGVNATIDDKRMVNTLEKIKGLIPEKELSEIKKSSEQVVFDFGQFGYNRLQKEKFNLIRKAIEERFVIRFHYTNFSGEELLRCVEPMTCILKGYAWYLFAYCRERQDYRVFRLSRLKNLEVLKERFEQRERSFGEYPWDIEPGKGTRFIDITLKFSPRVRVRVEDFFDAEAIEKTEDGSLLVRVTFPEDEWVYGNILSYGEDVEVLEPPHLKAIIKSKAEKIVGKYEA